MKICTRDFSVLLPKKYLLHDLVWWFFRLMRKDEKWGFQTYDMKYDPFFPIKVALANMSPAYPFGSLHWEWLEKEATSDNPLKGCPGLEDLGVTLTQMEDQVPWELRPYRAYQYYMDQIGEFPKPPNPKVVPC